MTGKVENRPKVKTGYVAPLMFGAVMFAALFAGVGVWMARANIAGAVIASGSVAVKGKPKTIQHLDGGIVAEIAISNGEMVKRGQILIQLDDTLLTSNLSIYRNRLEEAVARRARLEAERSNEPEIIWRDKDLLNQGESSDKRIKAGQQRLFKLRNETLSGQLAQMNEKISQYKNQVVGVNGLKNAKSEQVKLLVRELAGLKKLFEKGNATLTRVLNLERQKADLLGQLSEHDAELARIKNSINETRIEMLQMTREFRQGAQKELQDVRLEINNMQQQIFATKAQLKRIKIRAPVTGMVHELNVFTLGGVIGAGAAVMQIIPQNSSVEIEVNIEPQFIDELHLGQSATVRFSAFKSNSTPELIAAIAGISPSSIVDEQTGIAFYKVRLLLKDQEQRKLKGQKLVPGMPVEVFIKTKDRTALNYLLKPFLDQVNRAFREE